MPSATKMAETKAAICIAAVAAMIHVVCAADYIVGDPTGGWQGRTDYKSWAAAQSFAPGDTLTFKYSAYHNVVEVTADDYEACSTANPVSFDNSGLTTVALTAPGKRYFICGGPGHCQNGMKVEVDVADRPAPAAPSSPPQLPPSPLPPAPAPAAEPPRHAGHKRHKKWCSPPKPAPALAPVVQSSESYLPLAAVAPMSSPTPPAPMSSDAVAVWHSKWGGATLGLLALWFAVLPL
ncbi:early nodulin-like protein 14 [Lolium perenne]|uniref:early nodulin-like protein 14 n=1 Tax=Lolium perenne TaxID=4522 RepID=UPI0021F585C4|nr:blue copper protein-like [Lolium perenne]